MKCWSIRLLPVALVWLATTTHSPAPLIYTPGEGWTYESVAGGGKWQRSRAQDQLDVAREALTNEDYSLALKAARRTVRVWPLSDYAPEAQYIVGRSYEAKANDERAFKEYQKVVERYPRLELFQEVLQRQFSIADLYLQGKWFKLWGYIPYGPSMDKTAGMFEKIVDTGPYSDVAPQAQLKIGAAREKQKDFPAAVKAYEIAADRYNDRPAVAAEAIYRQGISYWKQAQKAEYDQSAAASAIEAFTDFITLYPSDPRVKECQQLIDGLHAEQARGNFEIALFYEKKHKYQGALVYYNEVLLVDPASKRAEEARNRIDELKNRITAAAN
jgi:outer membrane protein assembly factor BamD